MLPRREVEPVEGQAPVDLQIAHLRHPAGRPALAGQGRLQPERRPRLAHLLALGDLEATFGVLLPA